MARIGYLEIYVQNNRVCLFTFDTEFAAHIERRLQQMDSKCSKAWANPPASPVTKPFQYGFEVELPNDCLMQLVREFLAQGWEPMVPREDSRFILIKHYPERELNVPKKK